MQRHDDILMTQFYAGDNDALEELLTRHHRDLHWLLQRCVPDEAVARKLLVELYAAVFMSRFQPGTRFDATRGPVKGYLIALAGRLAYDWLLGRLSLEHHDET